MDAAGDPFLLQGTEIVLNTAENVLAFLACENRFNLPQRLLCVAQRTGNTPPMVVTKVHCSSVKISVYASARVFRVSSIRVAISSKKGSRECSSPSSTAP